MRQMFKEYYDDLLENVAFERQKYSEHLEQMFVKHINKQNKPKHQHKYTVVKQCFYYIYSDINYKMPPLLRDWQWIVLNAHDIRM